MTESENVRFPPILKFDVNKLESPFGHRPHIVNEFFLIEFLLRSQKVRRLYLEPNGEQKFKAVLKERGIHSQDPFSGSHHALLINNAKYADKMRELGYLDVSLGILDLGKMFTLPPGFEINCDGMVFRGSFLGGESECLARLRMSDPLRNAGALSLYLDATQPPDVVWTRLRPILQARHTEAMKQAGGKEASKPASAGKNDVEYLPSPNFKIRNVRTWIEYLYCYDLKYFEHQSYGDIGSKVYGTKGGARDLAKKAVKRIEQKIDYVERHSIPDEFIENPPFGYITLFNRMRTDPSSAQL